MKIVTILGARPQFIKAWATSRALAAEVLHEIVIHTGRHYDESLSGRYFSGDAARLVATLLHTTVVHKS